MWIITLYLRKADRGTKQMAYAREIENAVQVPQPTDLRLFRSLEWSSLLDRIMQTTYSIAHYFITFPANGRQFLPSIC